MDKAEYKIATEHIKKLISQGEYAEASHIADTIDWRRVKSVMMLCTVSDLYKVNRRYEDAKELLYMAYERNPESRTILYSLCDLSIKLEEFVAAIEYYKSFVEVAPRDTGRYVLQYRLYQAQDVSLEERIEVLEQLKREEYIEKWAYELAYLYHRIGFATKCVEECDELILWFGKGRYVYKAMELKMLHEPLTPSQQYIYDRRFEHLEQAKDMTRVLPRIDSGESEMTDEGMVDVTDAPTVEIPQEYIEKELHEEVEDIQVKTLDVANAYNTMNLQKELAASLREILDVSHTESSVDTTITEDVESEYADTAEMSREVAADVTEGIYQADIPEQQEMEAAEAEMVQEETAMEAAEAEMADEDMLLTEPEAEIVPEVVPAASQAETEVVPVEDAVETVEDVSEVITEAAVHEVKEPAIWAEPNFVESAAENVSQENMVEKQITGQLSIEDVLAEWDKQEEKAVEAHQDGISQRIKSQTQDIFAAIEAEMKKDLFDMAAEEEAAFAEETAPMEGEPVVEESAAMEDEPVAEELVSAEDEPVAEEPIPTENEAIDEESTVTEPTEQAKAEAKEQEDALDEEDFHAAAMNLKRYEQFIRSVDTEVQIMNVLDNAAMEATVGNISVTGHDLGICFDFIKVLLSDLKKQGITISGKTAKISAVNLNKKEPSEIIGKVQGGILIIERAGRLRRNIAEKLMECLQSDVSDVLIFLTDTKQGMNRLFDKNEAMHGFFNLRVDIKDYTSDELIEHAVKYALENEYSVDEMGLLALRTRIEEMIANDEALTLEDAEEIVDEAIDHVNRKTFKHFMDILLHKRYDEEDMIILREDDFL